MRNWRTLWASLPRERRSQMLLDMLRDNPGCFVFAGIRVCMRAFQKLTGISAGQLQTLREKVKQGITTVWRADSLAWMTMRNAAKAKKQLIAVFGWRHMPRFTVKSRQ